MTRKRVSENDAALSTGAGAAPLRRKTSSRTRAKHTSIAEPEVVANSTVETPEITAVTPLAASVTTAYQPTHQEIAELAFLYFEARGYQGGCAEEDWLRAEAELRQRSVAVAIANV